MDGIEALKKIRKIDSDVAVVIFNRLPEPRDRRCVMKLDAVDYIKKPFNVDEFREVLDRVMRKKGLARTPEEKLQGHRRHDPQPPQGEGSHAEADVSPTNLSVSLLSQSSAPSRRRRSPRSTRSRRPRVPDPGFFGEY